MQFKSVIPSYPKPSSHHSTVTSVEKPFCATSSNQRKRTFTTLHIGFFFTLYSFVRYNIIYIKLTGSDWRLTESLIQNAPQKSNVHAKQNMYINVHNWRKKTLTPWKLQAPQKYIKLFAWTDLTIFCCLHWFLFLILAYVPF